MNLQNQKQAMAWMEASTGELHVVSFHDEDLFYSESPEEQGLPDSRPQEHLVRVFTTKTEAERYLETVKAQYPETDGIFKFIVRSFHDFEALWPTLMGTNETFVRTLGLPVRAVLSRMDPDTWPQELGTVFSSQQLRN